MLGRVLNLMSVTESKQKLVRLLGMEIFLCVPFLVCRE